MQTKITPGEIVVFAAGGLALIASLLPFYKNGDSINAWDEGLFPVATLIMVFALAAAVLVALNKFANVALDNVLGFNLLQLVLAFGFFSAVLALAWLIRDAGFGVDRGFGLFILVLCGIGTVVGGVLMMNEKKSAGAGPGPGPV